MFPAAGLALFAAPDCLAPPGRLGGCLALNRRPLARHLRQVIGLMTRSLAMARERISRRLPRMGDCSSRAGLPGTLRGAA